MARMNLEQAITILGQNGFAVSKRTHGYRTYNSLTGEDRIFENGYKVVAFAKTYSAVAPMNGNFTELNRTFGVELECVRPHTSYTREEACRRVVRALEQGGVNVRPYEGYNHRVHQNSWKVVTDASVNTRGGVGIEVVSPVLRGEEGFEQIRKVCKILTENGYTVNRTCGTHCHFGCEGATSAQLNREFAGYQANEGIFDSLVSASRRGNRGCYCRSLQNVSTYGWNSTRYYKLNKQSFPKYGTLEVRQHQGTLNGKKLEMWIRLHMAFINYNFNGTTRSFTDLEQMLDTLGFDSEVKSWFLERQEELSA